MKKERLIKLLRYVESLKIKKRKNLGFSSFSWCHLAMITTTTIATIIIVVVVVVVNH